MIVNSNANSLFSRRAINGTARPLEVATARLASGLRINVAADDVAGQAIAGRMTSQVNGLAQAKRNANDGVSMAQTAEGALQQSSDLLQRIRQLAVQSANGTNSNSDRLSLQAEVDQLVYEFDRVSKDTEFNTRKLLDGSSLNTNLHVGANSNQNIMLGVRSTRAADLYSYTMGSEVTSVNSMQAAQTATSDGSISQRNRLQTQNLTVASKGMTGTVVLQAGTSAKEVASRINNALTNKQGLVSARAETYAMLTLSGTDTATIDFKLNGVSIQASSSRSDMDVDGLVSSINDEAASTKVVASKQKLAGGGYGVLLHATEGDDISLQQMMVRTGSAGAIGTVGVQGMYDTGSTSGLANVGAAVSLIAGNATSNRNTTVGGRVLMISDAAFSLVHSAAGSTGGFSAYASTSIVACDKGPTLLQADISTTYGSNTTIGLVDAILGRISMYRASLGAMQNRLGATQEFLSSGGESISGARSRINDADFAQETANLARIQVTQQAGMAILAQANTAPQRALELLRG